MERKDEITAFQLIGLCIDKVVVSGWTTTIISRDVPLRSYEPGDYNMFTGMRYQNKLLIIFGDQLTFGLYTGIHGRTINRR